MSVNNWIRRWSIARKLTAIGIITSVSSLVIAAAVVITYDRSSSRESIRYDTEQLAEMVGDATTGALAFGDAKGATETLGARQRPDRRAARLHDDRPVVSRGAAGHPQ